MRLIPALFLLFNRQLSEKSTNSVVEQLTDNWLLGIFGVTISLPKEVTDMFNKIKNEIKTEVAAMNIGNNISALRKKKGSQLIG